MATMRTPSKNICSVRQSPIPSAPNERAMRASAGVSALVRTFMRRISSAHAMTLEKSPDSSGCSIGTTPFSTCPVPPSMVMTSPLRSVTPIAMSVPLR